jgi:transcriptional regulator with XRE-family HTH domain
MISVGERSVRVVVGRQIALARRRRGWTQADLAEALDIEGSTLSRYECGVREPPLHLLLDIARVLRVPLVALLDLPEADVALDVASPSAVPEVEEVVALWPSLVPTERALVLAVVRALVG